MSDINQKIFDGYNYDSIDIALPAEFANGDIIKLIYNKQVVIGPEEPNPNPDPEPNPAPEPEPEPAPQPAPQPQPQPDPIVPAPVQPQSSDSQVQDTYQEPQKIEEVIMARKHSIM